MTETSLPQIGQFFGGRDHTTVIHAYDKISQDKETDNRLGGILNELIDRIQKVWPCLIHALVLHNEGVDKFVEIHLEFLLAICG